jgi:hypothetical protein
MRRALGPRFWISWEGDRGLESLHRNRAMPLTIRTDKMLGERQVIFEIPANESLAG